MSSLVCRNCGVDVAGEPLFRKVSFALEPGEKVGLIGPNGAGKTTLIRACLGMHPWEEGESHLTCTVGYLPQIPMLDERGTVYEGMLEERKDLLDLQAELRDLEHRMAESGDEKVFSQYAALTEKYERQDGYGLDARIRRILAGLGLGGETGSRISHLSGGQKTRLALAKLLLRSPELLILDEPTNHLDIEATEWLENFLRDYNGGVIIISHDRYFLDQIVTKVLRLDQGSLKGYRGNYSEYELQRVLEEKTLEREAERLARKIARLEDYVRRNRAGVNAKQARGREIQLQKLKPVQVSGGGESISLGLGRTARSGDRVLDLDGVSLSFPNRQLFQNVQLDLRRGDKVALLGKNGVGKTSLLRCIMGQLSYQGRIRLGANVKIAYYSQEHENLNLSLTVIDEIRHASKLEDPAIRSLLARFGFRGEDVFKPVRSLSGGEKSRLALCKLFLEDGNLLLLDEPTNHLDGETRAELEETLGDYEGTALIVSHDRYFLDRVVNKVARLTEDGLSLYQGDYTGYREALREEEKSGEKEAEKILPAQMDRAEGKNLARQRKRLEKMEMDIKKFEEKLATLELEMEAHGADYERSIQLHQTYEETRTALEEAMEAWAEAAEE